MPSASRFITMSGNVPDSREEQDVQSAQDKPRPEEQEAEQATEIGPVFPVPRRLRMPIRSGPEFVPGEGDDAQQQKANDYQQ
jgi:hypothetical protein